MITEKMREEFRRIVGIDWLEGAEVCKIWQLAWQASRAAIEVELPETDQFIDYPGYISRSDTEYVIESLGLKVKP